MSSSADNDEKQSSEDGGVEEAINDKGDDEFEAAASELKAKPVAEVMPRTIAKSVHAAPSLASLADSDHLAGKLSISDQVLSIRPLACHLPAYAEQSTNMCSDPGNGVRYMVAFRHERPIGRTCLSTRLWLGLWGACTAAHFNT